MTNKYESDVIIIGGGIAGIIAAIELLDQDKSVLILDRDVESKFGGQAKESFGGVFMAGSPLQKKMGIDDSPELALKDWHSFAEFGEGDDIPKAWAKMFVERSVKDLYYGLKRYNIKYFPVVHWVERGLFKPGNTVPRFHMIWGTGQDLVTQTLAVLLNHPNKGKLQLKFDHCVDDLVNEASSIKGCTGTSNGEDFTATAEHIIVATGGFGANLKMVRDNWHTDWGTPPDNMLIGCHQYSDGKLHDVVEKHNGNVTHKDWMWNYAAGIQHPLKEKGHGLSMVPSRSALWMNYKGERIGPVPMITSFDTRQLVTDVCKQDRGYSWQILNWKIALKEMAVSGNFCNDAIRDKKLLKFLIGVLFGNSTTVETLSKGDEFIMADSLEELGQKMNEHIGDDSVDVDKMISDVRAYDAQIDRGQKYFNDDQLRRIAHVRQYKGDKMRTCKFQKIDDPNAYPLMAIKLRVILRKSLGGIQTDLKSRVLDNSGEAIKGLYAIGEAAGFGGGGMHGIRALEGTFLGGCVISAKVCAEGIKNA